MGKILQFPIQNAVAPPPPPEIRPPVEDPSAIALIAGIPVIEQALFFLREASNDKGVRLTEKGFLNRDFVQSFWESQLRKTDPYYPRPSREYECTEATRVLFLVEDAKYVRKNKGYLTLTEKGRTVLEKGRHVELYRDLFWSAMMEWNWAYEDRYPEFEFIQDSGPELVKLLLQWPKATLTAAEFFDEAFETVIEEGAAFDDKNDEDDEDADPYGVVLPERIEEQALCCFQTRFIQRFCGPFGILRDLNGSRISWQPEDLYEKTEFLKSAFSKTVFGRSVVLL